MAWRLLIWQRRSKSRAARRNLRCRRYHSACHQSFKSAKSFVNGCIRCLVEQQDGCQRQIDDAGLWLQVLQSAVLRNESYSFFYARKIPPLLRTMGFCSVKQCVCLNWLLTKTEGLDDSTIAIDVAIIQVIEQCTTLSYKLCQRTCCSIIFTVLLNMFRQMSNTVWEQCYLALSWTSIRVRLSVLAKDLFFFLLCLNT